MMSDNSFDFSSPERFSSGAAWAAAGGLLLLAASVMGCGEAANDAPQTRTQELSTTAPCTTCTAYSGTLSSTGDGAVEPGGTYYHEATAGQHRFWLQADNPQALNLKLETYRWDGSAWRKIGIGRFVGSNLNGQFTSSSGYFTFVVTSLSGSGGYTLYLQKPSDSGSGGNGSGTTTTSGVDFAVTSGSLEDTSAVPGARVTVDYRIANVGTRNSNDVEVAYVLSKDATLSTDDTVLERETLGDFDAGDIEDESEQVTLPSNIAAGVYSFFVVADYPNHYAENNETNNVLRRTLRITTTSPSTGGAPCTACTPYTGTLSSTGDGAVEPGGTYYQATAGQHRFWLQADNPQALSLKLEAYRWDGSSWRRIGRFTGSDLASQFTGSSRLLHLCRHQPRRLGRLHPVPAEAVDGVGGAATAASRARTRSHRDAPPWLGGEPHFW